MSVAKCGCGMIFDGRDGQVACDCCERDILLAFPAWLAKRSLLGLGPTLCLCRMDMAGNVVEIVDWEPFIDAYLRERPEGEKNV